MNTIKKTALAVGVSIGSLLSCFAFATLGCNAMQMESAGSKESTKVAYGLTGIVTKTYAPALNNVNLDSATIKDAGDADVSFDGPNVINVHSGEVIVQASKPTVVVAGQHKVSLPGGSITLITNQPDVLKVRNLYENRGNSLRVYIAKSYLTLASGQELVIASNLQSLSNSVSTDSIARRKVKLFKLSGGGTMLRSEYMPVTLLKRTGVLKQLYLSEDSADRSLSKKLIKMAACLAYATASHGNFKYVTP